MKKLVIVGLSLMLSLTPLVASAGVRTADDDHYDGKHLNYAVAFKTDDRDKDNTSYVYYYNRGNFDHKVRTISFGTNQTKSGYAIIPRGREMFITNYVRENGYKKVYLLVNSTRFRDSGKSNFSWSPDSVGVYPVANP